MQGSDSYRLIVRRGPQPNQVYELTDEVMNLGRDITNQLVINDREVSRHHLRFVRGADGITMEDLGSTNGTFINGRRVTGATLLKNGDMIGLGETVTLGYEVVRAGMNNVAVYPTPNPAQQPTIPAQPASQPPAASPYQPPQNPSPTPQQPPAASPYQPPLQPAAQPYQPQQPVPDPYAPPAYQQAGQPAYQQPAYNDPYAAQQQPAYNDPYQQSYNPPPPPGYAGYDQHDPFGMREEEGGNSTRIFLYGCAAIMLLCCCCSVIGFVAIDSLCLYDNIPFLGTTIRALGIGINCAR
jgi:hypothetical protein